MIHVADAHALVWYLEDNPKLSEVVGALLDDPSTRLVVPTIALVEIGHRHQRKKIRTSLADVRSLIDSLSNAVIVPFDEATLDSLPAGLEIHDAIIVATALVLATNGSVPVRVLTRDQQIIASGLVDVVW